MIKARLADGSIIELKKDCGCIIHDEPHWLHMNDVSKRLNRSLIDRAIRTGHPLAVKAAADAELWRLGELRWNMEHHKIVEIIREGN